MITYVQGNLLRSNCDVLVHGCNCFVTWGAGIALQVKKEFPMAYEEDRQTRVGDIHKLGHIQIVPCTGKYIINLYSQYDCSTNTVQLEYGALGRGLRRVKEWADLRANWPKIGMPRIGCGLAGGDWDQVSQLIEGTFSDNPVFIYDYTPPPRMRR